MEHDEIAYLRSRSAAWRVLRADHAPLILATLGQVFVVDNVRTIAESDLIAAVDDQLHALNHPAVQAGEDPPYPRSAKQYVDAWSSPEQGLLRKFYPDGSAEAHLDATSDLEKAYAWVTGLRARSFVGTESRLHTVIEVLRQIVHGSESDPRTRLAELHRRRAAIDAEIERTEAGEATTLDEAALRDRYQHFSSTARELLADFREVEENFRALDRGAREQIAAWAGSKGELLEQLIGDRHAITSSDQGRSFQAFHDFLLSRSRQEELGALLERLVELDAITVDRRLRHVHHDWLDASERTQATVRQLSEQLRRFLDDKVWLENRRVMDLLRSIERTALAVRHEARPTLEMELDALSPRIRLPLERPLYAPAPTVAIDSTAVVDAGDADLGDASALLDHVHVDSARLLANVRSALRHRDQVSLDDLLEEHPPSHGLAEILGYLSMAEEDIDVVTDESVLLRLPYTDAAGALRVLRMPQATMVRRQAIAAGTTGRMG